jgi:hypothetical protein
MCSQYLELWDTPTSNPWSLISITVLMHFARPSSANAANRGSSNSDLTEIDRLAVPAERNGAEGSGSDSFDWSYLVDAVGIEPTTCRLRVEDLRVGALYLALTCVPILCGFSALSRLSSYRGLLLFSL